MHPQEGEGGQGFFPSEERWVDGLHDFYIWHKNFSSLRVVGKNILLLGLRGPISSLLRSKTRVRKIR
jgi:hypothetical protein